MPRFLHQRHVVDRLAFDAKKMLRDRVELPASEIVNERWNQVRGDIQAFARGVWGQMDAQDSPITAELAKQRIVAYMTSQLRGFRNWVVDVLNNTKRQAFEHQFLVNHWILDQVTPPNIEVRPRRDVKIYMPTGGFHRKIGVKEAWYDDPVFSGGTAGGAGAGGEWPEPPPSGGAGGGAEWWDEPTAGTTDVDKKTGLPVASHEMRLDFYLKAFAIAAGATGLAYAAIQAYEPGDVDDMIATATTDGQQMEHVLSRLIKTEIQVSIADSDEAFTEDFAELLKRKYWQTMEDERVCPICRANEGRTDAAATHNIPAHPGCRCYWRMEPVSFKALAGALGVRQLGAGTMAIRDPVTGELTGSMVIDFDGWKQAVAA